MPARVQAVRFASKQLDTLAEGMVEELEFAAVSDLVGEVVGQ